MSKLKQAFLTFSIGNIAFYCIYSVIYFATYFINQKGFPLLSSFFAFWLAVILTKLLAGRKVYIFLIILLQGIGCLFPSLLILKAFYDPGGSLFELSWLPVLLFTPRSVVDTMILLLIIAGTLLLWILGMRFGLNKGGYKNTIKIFENSLYALFFMAMMAGFIKADIPQMPLYILAVFLWGVLSIALSKNSSWGSGSKSGHGSFRMIFFFISGLLVSILTILTFLMDHLKWAAATGLDLVRTAVDPISPYLIALLKALFSLMGYRVRQDSVGDNAPEQGISPSRAVEVNGNDGFMMQLLMGIFVLLISLLFIFLLIVLFKMLLRKREGNDHPVNFIEMLREVWQEFIAMLINIRKWCRMILAFNRNGRLVEKVYAKLVRWGTFRGIDHVNSDTPYEYTDKLSAKYSQFSSEFKIIADYFCAEIYGEKPLTDSEEISLKAAWKRIRKV
ncbi:MAG: DUF4129 domain-containing protein [Syntrophomonadaceae bacterium]|nr:DUF4129 domain-containing protein [Syntrophomonadaceae bacterium]